MKAITGRDDMLCSSGDDFRKSYVHEKPDPRTAPPNIGISSSQSRHAPKKNENRSRKKKLS